MCGVATWRKESMLGATSLNQLDTRRSTSCTHARPALIPCCRNAASAPPGPQLSQLSERSGNPSRAHCATLILQYEPNTHTWPHYSWHTPACPDSTGTRLIGFLRHVGNCDLAQLGRSNATVQLIHKPDAFCLNCSTGLLRGSGAHQPGHCD